MVNTSPWIALSICGQVPLLKELYSDIYLPSAVREEIMAGGRRDIGIRELQEHSWLRFGEIAGIEKVEFLHELERGEAEVIVLAKEKRIDLVLIVTKLFCWDQEYILWNGKWKNYKNLVRCSRM